VNQKRRSVDRSYHKKPLLLQQAGRIWDNPCRFLSVFLCYGFNAI
jgi:hypothetical protein